MTMSRRSVLVVLGLATAGSSAAESKDLFGEVVNYGDNEPGFQFGRAHRDRTAMALERLAKDIRDGGSLVHKTSLLTKSEPDEFVVHTLSIEFVMMIDKDASS